jgi:hypothetical protein
MNVRDLIHDAGLLLHKGRFESALVLVLVAIAGTSKKRYPPSHPGDRNDRKSFTRFVHDEMRVITPCTNMTAKLGGRTMSIEDILYEFLRCKILHEAEMPKEVLFEDCKDFRIRPGPGCLVMSANWIVGLMRSVVLARENKSLFQDIASSWLAPWAPGGSGPSKVLGTLNIHIGGCDQEKGK